MPGLCATYHLKKSVFDQKFKVKVVLNYQEINALDDLFDLYLDGEFNEKGINRDALLQIQGRVRQIIAVVNRRFGFVDKNAGEGMKGYLM